MKQVRGILVLILALFLPGLHAEAAFAQDVQNALPYLAAAGKSTASKQAKAPLESRKKPTADKALKKTGSAADAKKGSQDKAVGSATSSRKGSQGKAAGAAQSAKKKQKATGKAARAKKRAALPPASADLPQSGLASWVGYAFHGKPVAMGGEVYELQSLTAAHRALPFGSLIKVTALESGRSVLVRVNDRGPYVKGRVVDLARGAAEYLGYASRGLTEVRIEDAGRLDDPKLRYYLRLAPQGGSGHAFISGLGPFERFDEAAALLLALYGHYPNIEILAAAS